MLQDKGGEDRVPGANGHFSPAAELQFDSQDAATAKPPTKAPAQHGTACNGRGAVSHSGGSGCNILPIVKPPP